MPLEGQWQRANTPLRHLTARERRVAFAGTALVAIAIVVLLVTTGGRSQPAPAPGCIRATIPHVMGAEQLNACAQRARHLCAQSLNRSDPGARAIAAGCREAGVL